MTDRSEFEGVNSRRERLIGDFLSSFSNFSFFLYEFWPASTLTVSSQFSRSLPFLIRDADFAHRKTKLRFERHKETRKITVRNNTAKWDMQRYSMKLEIMENLEETKSNWKFLRSRMKRTSVGPTKILLLLSRTWISNFEENKW